jgi:glycerophosphoryl diester phosphodiesterase
MVMRENPWLSRRIVNFAHQGGAHEAPSSTLYAIEEGLRAGASAVELDVHATKDRVLVVCHDETIDRTTNGTGEICDLELSELQSCDNSYWFIEGADVTPGRDEKEYSHRGKAPKDHSFGIATLEEVLLTFPQTVFNMDIKRTAPEVAPYEELLSTTLAKCGRSDDVIVASFNDLAIQEFRRQSPDTLTSAATLETANFIRAVQAGETPEALNVVAFQVPETFGELTLVTEQFIEAAHGANIAVHVWTINDTESMERLISLGVDGIISDRPSLLTSVLGSQAWDGTR